MCSPSTFARHNSDGPAWLTFLGHSKDSLWSVELFRCESLMLKTHGVIVVMDQFTRRIIGFAVQAGAVDGAAICRMFNHAIAGTPLCRSTSAAITIRCSRRYLTCLCRTPSLSD